ncbi:MAG: Crp/Fnr family transcriptional regulator [Actinomycetota bacterium]|nr:Crp/Fnr family transcriptional regulator [Actinomycetota bacterium]
MTLGGGHLSAVLGSVLFDGVDAHEAEMMLECLSARMPSYAAGTWLVRPGDHLDAFGIVLSGCVHVVIEDYWGNTNILKAAGPSDLFALSYACISEGVSQVGAVAVEDCTVLWMDIRRVLTTCSSACVFHARLIRNLVEVLAQENAGLTSKVEHLSRRTVREKVLSYLSTEAHKQGSDRVVIPFNRQQMADYLSVERSGLSVVLGKLRDEGLIEYHKNTFRLLK